MCVVFDVLVIWDGKLLVWLKDGIEFLVSCSYVGEVKVKVVNWFVD